MQIRQRITPFLSYIDRAEEAAQFYVSAFPESRIHRTIANPANGAVLTVEFELSGMKFIALNAGQDWKFTEAISFGVYCDTQEEIDTLWAKLTADGGREVSCGWLQDKFGMFWQVWPSRLDDWFGSSDPQKLQRMFSSLWQMNKLDIETLQRAFDGE